MERMLEDLLELCLRGVAGVAVWLLGHPKSTSCLVGMLVLGHVLGPWAPIAVLYATAFVLALWYLVHPPSWGRVVWRPFWGGIVGWWRYRLSWKTVVAQSGLVVNAGDGVKVVPRLVRVQAKDPVDVLVVRLVSGQTPEDFERRSDALAHAFGARGCRVRVLRPGRLRLEFASGDPLHQVVPAIPPGQTCDLGGVPVGRTEFDTPWTLRVLGNHLLVAGVTGAGKGSVIWSLLNGLAPAIHTGTVQVWAIDPKGGMELGIGKPLFARFACDDYAAMAHLLEEAVREMRERAARLAGVTRLHAPTPEDPLILIVIDEVANLTAYLPDRKIRDQFQNALALLLSQGRAVGVSVVGALQDPRKEVLTIRNLFPTKIALRLDEPVQVDMVLGAGARDRGAICDRIPEGLPGVGYVRDEGIREPIRIRASYLSDTDIRELARDYAAQRPPLAEAA